MAVSSNPSGELAKITVPDLIMVNEMNCGALSILRFKDYLIEFVFI